MADDTVVVFNTDHGPELPRGKWTLLDGGVGIAFIIRWPGGPVVKGGKCTGMLSNIDWMPTVCDLLDAPYPNHQLDGRSFRSLLCDLSLREHREILGALFVNGQTRCIRTETFKLIRDFSEGFLPGTRTEKPDVELYDLSADPYELRNLAQDPAYASNLAEMDSYFWSWLRGVGDPLLKGPVVTPRFRRMMEAYKQHCDQPVRRIQQ
jgi:arylsulfatase A-like enzyme